MAVAASPSSCGRRRVEIMVDAVIHVIGLVGGIAGSVALLAMAAVRGGVTEIAVSTVYLCGLLAMFACSAIYNLWHSSHRRELLQGLDHAAIFVMIAGSYTPFSILLLDGGWALGITALVWTVAAAGIAMRLWLPRAFRRCRLVLYLALGWIGVVAIGPLMGVLDGPTLLLLGVGGLTYTLGVTFHVWTSLPFHNAIWHSFVLAGACFHYAAVYNGVAIASQQLQLAWLGLT